MVVLEKAKPGRTVFSYGAVVGAAICDRHAAKTLAGQGFGQTEGGLPTR
jgi:hypothetical protein